MQRKKLSSLSGFTLIELLVVIAIIGLLSTVAVVALNSARVKARDARRVADVKQIQTALELYSNDHNSSYPHMATDGTTNYLSLGEGETCAGGSPCLCMGASGSCTCLDSNGFGTACTADPKYMGSIPKNPGPGGSPYTYISQSGNGLNNCNSNDPEEQCDSYELRFLLEGGIPSLGTGIDCIATQSKITCS